MKYGYARVSSIGQNLTTQINTLKEQGCEKIFQEKVSGKNKNDRQSFNELLETVKENDSIVVTKLDRFARSTKDALTTIDALNDRGVGLALYFIKTLLSSPSIISGAKLINSTLTTMTAFSANATPFV